MEFVGLTSSRPAGPYAEQVPSSQRYRIVQWNTGNVGKSSVKAIVENPAFDLVGCYAWSKDKVGRDVGELCGGPPLGVAATDDVAGLLALKPDCVVYNAMWPNVEELVGILSAGVNVVATASFITGHNLGDGRDQILEACARGGATIFGSGVSPGFAELLAIVAANACDRVDKVTIQESADTTFYDSRNGEAGRIRLSHRRSRAGAKGLTGHRDLRRSGSADRRFSGRRTGRDPLRCRICTDDRGSRSRLVDHSRRMCRRRARKLEGSSRRETIVDVNVRWRKGQSLTPDWQLGPDGWKITIDGRPTVTMQVGFLPPLLRGDDTRGVHGAGPHHDGDAADSCDSGRRRCSTRYRDLQRPASHPGSGRRAESTRLTRIPCRSGENDVVGAALQHNRLSGGEVAPTQSLHLLRPAGGDLVDQSAVGSYGAAGGGRRGYLPSLLITSAHCLS